MNKIFLMCTLFLLTVPLTTFAIPAYITHQGKVIDSSNDPVTGVIEVTFSLYSQETGGSAVWTEDIDIAFDAGHYSVILGSANSLDPDLFDRNELFLGVALAQQNEFVPRSRITSVPYAFLAESVIGKVDALDGLSVNGTPLIDSNGQWMGLLKVDGAVQIASSSATCTSELAGTFRWNSDQNQMQVCDGTQWGNIGGSGSGSGDLSLPEIASISPEQIDENADVTITINGQGFVDDCEVEFGNVLSESVSVESDTEIQATTGDSLGSGTYRVRVTNPSGLRGALNDGLLVDDAPNWITAEGDLGFLLDFMTGEHFTLEASDTENQTMSYTVTAGALPTGSSLDSSTGIISGDLNEVSENTVFNFTVTATDTAPVPNTTDRDFSILVMHRIGTDSNFPGDDCAHILEVYDGEESGVFWVDLDGEGGEPSFQVYCDMETQGGGWTLVMNVEPSDGNVVSFTNTTFWQTDAEFGDFSAYFTGDYKSPVSYRLPSDAIMVQVANPGETGAIIGWKAWNMDVKTFDSFFDSGANTTQTTSLIAEEVSSVYAYEAVIKNGNHLQSNRSINPNTDRVRLGVDAYSVQGDDNQPGLGTQMNSGICTNCYRYKDVELWVNSSTNLWCTSPSTGSFAWIGTDGGCGGSCSGCESTASPPYTPYWTYRIYVR